MKNLKSSRGRSGFTLIEMAIVLVIIGVIISAVSISQNLQRSAETQRIKQKFLDQWVIAYNQYYSRTGVVVGDSQQEPRFMVSGADYAYNDNGGPGVPGADGTSIDSQSRSKICEGQGYINGEIEESNYELSDQGLHELMDRVGIRMPPSRAEGREDRYLYLDSNGNPQEMQICFQWNPAGATHGSGNAMVVRGLTPDLARELDRMVDGKADAIEGMFRQYNEESHDTNAELTSGEAGIEWIGNNTYAQGEQGSITEDQDGDNLDEDQIMLITAIYKMDQ